MFIFCLQRPKSVAFERLVVKVSEVWLWSLEEMEKKKRKMKSVFEKMRREFRENGQEKIKECMERGGFDHLLIFPLENLFFFFYLSQSVSLIRVEL